ncbi:MAG: MBL fold metallo-hydrolase [Firmicutes bacterium]|nr:MBL fold metallo-hydrolase [Bacillota bacterium]
MRLALGCIASGSSGNSYLVKSENVSILVDAGISGKRILEGLKAFGVTDTPKGVLITHEHSDHIQGLPALTKRGVTVYANKETGRALSQSLRSGSFSEIKTGEVFSIGDIKISSFSVSHDAADPIGYSFEKDGACVSIITDTGYVTEDCFRYMKKADILVLESNHDESMLRIGRYPWFLKQRILSDAGHLSNEAAAQAVVRMLLEDSLAGNIKYRKLLLAHLSQENNFPEMAMATMSNILESKGFCCGRDISVETLSRSSPSKLFVI